jgi:hypothetical protein
MFPSLVSLRKVVVHNLCYPCPDAAAKEGHEVGKFICRTQIMTGILVFLQLTARAREGYSIQGFI